MSNMDLIYSKIGDLCNVSSSRRVFAKQYVEEGIPFYRQKEIIDKKNGNALEDPIFISESVYNEFKKKSGVPARGDLLITAVGATLGIPYVVEDEKFYFKDGNLIWLNNFSNALNSEFLYYWIDSSFGTQTLWNRAIGSAQPALTIDSIKKLSIPIPQRYVQDKIATTLKTYDALIENNNKRIAILEQMAENLYKEWFVRRRNPAWEYIRLSDFGYSLESGSRPKGGIDASLQDGYPSLGAEAIGRLGEFDFSSTKLVPEDFYKKMKRGIGKDKDILLYKDGAYIGKVTLFMDEFPYKDYSINEHVFLMRSNESLYQYYLYFTLALPQYFTQMQNLNRNAAQPGLTGKDIDTLKLYRPDEDTIRKFNSAIEPMMHNIFSLAKKNQILIKQRDLLLPRLMSGKLEV